MRFELLTLQGRLGRTSIYVTHGQAEAMVMSDRIILMNQGKIVQESNPRDLYERPTSRFAAAFVGNANLLDGQVTAEHGDGWYSVRLEGGLDCAAAPRSRAGGPTAKARRWSASGPSMSSPPPRASPPR